MTEENRKEFFKRIKNEAKILREFKNTIAEIDHLEKTSEDIKKYFKLKDHLEQVDSVLTELQRTPFIYNCKHEIFVSLGRKKVHYHGIEYAQVYKCLDCGDTKHFFEEAHSTGEETFKEENIIIYPDSDHSADSIQLEYYKSLITNSAEEARGKVLGKYYKKNK